MEQAGCFTWKQAVKNGISFVVLGYAREGKHALEVPQGGSARINYDTQVFGVNLQASDDFTHLVVYSPRGKGYFCVENQTCSTDAHNLYDRGFTVESGLKFVKAGATHSGSVKYKVEWR